MARPLKIGFTQVTNDTDLHLYRPLSFGYLKAYAEKYLRQPIEMRFLDEIGDIADLDIIGISAMSEHFAIATDTARLIKSKRPEVITILGGHHITYLPDMLPAECDLGVIGEGEQTFLELIQHISRNGLRLKTDDLRRINGIVFHEGDGIVATDRRELITPLDSIPIPYREPGHTPYMFSSRGCPYSCAFCSSSAFWDTTRFFSAEYVVKEIEGIVKSFPGVTNIPIWDDLFVANKPRFRKIVEMVEKRRLTERVSFNFSVRANFIDDELALALKRMNVSSTGFGAESGSDRSLKILNKGTTVEVNQRAIDTLHRHGIPVSCSFIVGSPGETEHDVRLTYEFILKNIIDGKLSPSGAIVNILMAKPGTAIWDYAVRAGLVDPKTLDWNRLSGYASYRNSTAKDFAEWVEIRRRKDAIYLDEDTIPQERLLELMYVYENAIKAFEKKA